MSETNLEPVEVPLCAPGTLIGMEICFTWSGYQLVVAPDQKAAITAFVIHREDRFPLMGIAVLYRFVVTGSRISTSSFSLESIAEIS